jgi:hypothetical protein
MTDDLMLAILSLDSYDRNFDQQLRVSSNQLGDAMVQQVDLPSGAESIGFNATAYDLNGQTIISYRGTDTTSKGSLLTAALNGFGVGAGFAHGPQANAAIQFFQMVAAAEDTSLKQGGADAGDWRSANIELTGHSLGGGLAGLVGAIYGKQGTLFDNETFNNAAINAYDDAKSPFLSEDPAVAGTRGFPGWAQFIYGAAAESPYAPDFSGLKAFATNGEILEGLLPLRALQTPAVNFLDSHADAPSVDPSNLHSMALLTLLIYARDNMLTDWASVGNAFYNAYFNDQLGTALGFKQGSDRDPQATGTGAPSTQMLDAIAYSALQGPTDGLPFGDTGIQSLFADADTLGNLQNANLFTGLLAPAPSSTGEGGFFDPRTGVGALAEIAVQFAGDQARAANTDSSLAQGAFELDGSVLKVDFDPAEWKSTADAARSAQSSGTAIVGLGDFVQGILSNLASGQGSNGGWLSDNAKQLSASLVTRLNEITEADIALGGGDLSAAGQLPTAFDGKVGGALLIGNQGQGSITGSANGNDLIIGGATVKTGDGNDLIVTSAGPETFNLGAGNNVILAGGKGVNDTFNYTSTAGTDLVIGNAMGGDTFNFTNPQNAGFTVVWGGTGADTFNFTADPSANVSVFALNIAGVTPDSLQQLDLNKLKAYTDSQSEHSLGQANPSIVVLNPTATDTISWNGKTVVSPQLQLGLVNTGTLVDPSTWLPSRDLLQGLVYQSQFFSDQFWGLESKFGLVPGFDGSALTFFQGAQTTTVETNPTFISLSGLPGSPFQGGVFQGGVAYDGHGSKIVNTSYWSQTARGQFFINNFSQGNFGITIPDITAKETSFTSSTGSHTYAVDPNFLSRLQRTAQPQYDTSSNETLIRPLGAPPNVLPSLNLSDYLKNNDNGNGGAGSGNGGGGASGSGAENTSNVSGFAASQASSASGGLSITDTAASVSAQFDALNADSNITAITLTDADSSALALTALQVVADAATLNKITNADYQIAITDTATDVSSVLDALNANSHIGSITLVDSGTPTLDLTVAQALNDGAALVNISNAYAIDIFDTAANVLANEAALGADGKIAATTVVDSVANVIANSSALATDTQVTSITVVDSVANILSNSVIHSYPKVTSEVVVDTAANILGNATAIAADGKITEAIVSDTAANISSNIDALNGDNSVNAIDLTDAGVADLTLSVAQTFNDSVALGKIQNANFTIAISDTVANVVANLGLLANDPQVGSITLTDAGSPTLTLTAEQAIADLAALKKITNANAVVAVADTAADVAAHLDALNANLQNASITLTDSGTPTLTLSVVQALGDGTALEKITNSNYAIAVVDSAINISAFICDLTSNPRISSVTLTGAATSTLDLTLAELSDDAPTLSKITNSSYNIAVFDSAANILAAGSILSGDPRIDSVTVIDSASNILSNESEINADAQITAVKVADTATAVSANLDDLSGNSKVGAIILADSSTPTLHISVAQLLDDSSALNRIANAYTIAITDSAAVFAANIDVLNPVGNLASITLTDASVPTLDLSAAQFVADSDALSKITNADYGVTITDSLADILPNLAMLNGNPRVSINVVDSAANVSTGIDALKAITNLSSISFTDRRPTLSLTATQVVGDAAVLAKIGGSYSISVTDTASNVFADESALSENSQVTSIAVADSAANILANLPALQADDQIASITVVDSVANVLMESDNLASLAGSAPIEVFDTAANILANASALNANPQISSIAVVDSAAVIGPNYVALFDIPAVLAFQLTDSGTPEVTLSASAVSDSFLLGAGGAKYEVNVVDTAANVAANIDQFFESPIASITLTDDGVPSLGLTVDQVITDNDFLGKITNPTYAVLATGTAANVSDKIDALNGVAAHLSSITLTDSGVATLNLSVAQTLNDTAVLNKITNVGYTIAVSDTAANILGSAAALRAVSLISSLEVTDSVANVLTSASQISSDPQINGITVVDSAANVLDNSAALSSNSLVNSIEITDTAANIATNIDTLNHLSGLSSITLTDFNPLKLTVAQALNDTNVFDAITPAFYQISISDTAANIAGNLAALNDNFHVASLSVEDTFANFLANTFASSNLPVIFCGPPGPTVTITSASETNVAIQTITGTVTTDDAASVVGQTVTLTENDTTLGTATVQADGTFRASVTLLNSGFNVIVASVTDSSGAAGSTSVLNILNNIAPTVTITSTSQTNTAAETITGSITSGGSTTVVGQVVTLTDNGTKLGTATVQDDGSFSVNVTLPNQGANSIVASVTDSSGNAGSSSAIVTLDSVAPTVTISSTEEASNVANQTITGSIISGGAAVVVGQTVTLTDNGTTLGATTVQSDGTFSSTVTLPDQGSNALLASVTDSFGNTNNTYLATTGSGQIAIAAQGGAGTTNDLDFTGGITDQNLWFLQSGNDLKIDILGTNTSVTAAGWFSSSANQFQEIMAGGLKIDSQVSQLVQAMATYSASNLGFDPTATTVPTLPNDTNLQTSLAAAWHS